MYYGAGYMRAFIEVKIGMNNIYGAVWSFCTFWSLTAICDCEQQEFIKIF